MTTKTFNWDYRAINAYATSRVNDERPRPTQFADQLTRQSEITHSEERKAFFQRNPHLLSNIHS